MKTRIRAIKTLSVRAAIGLLIAVVSGLPSNSMADDLKEDSTGQRPSVYSVEHTGASFPAPVLPAMADLPTVAPLTDPFMWSDGSGSDKRMRTPTSRSVPMTSSTTPAGSTGGLRGVRAFELSFR